MVDRLALVRLSGALRLIHNAHIFNDPALAWTPLFFSFAVQLTIVYSFGTLSKQTTEGTFNHG